MEHSFEHDLTQEEARRVADRAWGSYAQRLGKWSPEVNWIDEYRAEVTFRAKGISLTGELEIRAGWIDITLDVPLIFHIFKSRAVTIVEKEINFWIANHKQGSK